MENSQTFPSDKCQKNLPHSRLFHLSSPPENNNNKYECLTYTSNVRCTIIQTVGTFLVNNITSQPQVSYIKFSLTKSHQLFLLDVKTFELRLYI